MADKAKSAPPVISRPFISLTLPEHISSALQAASQTTGVPAAGKAAVLGRTFATGQDILVGEEERCGGLYILGQPRTGKSNLLVSLALNDIKEGCGILFIDPHTDAISDLQERIPGNQKKTL